jgi:hypothetical protein
VVTILVGSKKCSDLIIEGTVHRSPASLAYSTQNRLRFSSCLFSSGLRARPGPSASNHADMKPCGSCIDTKHGAKDELKGATPIGITLQRFILYILASLVVITLPQFQSMHMSKLQPNTIVHK